MVLPARQNSAGKLKIRALSQNLLVPNFYLPLRAGEKCCRHGQEGGRGFQRIPRYRTLN